MACVRNPRRDYAVLTMSKPEVESRFASSITPAQETCQPGIVNAVDSCNGNDRPRLRHLAGVETIRCAR